MKVARLLLHMKHFELTYYHSLQSRQRAAGYLTWLMDTRYRHLKLNRRLLLLCP